MLLTARQSVCLIDHQLLIVFKAIAVAVGTDVNLGSNDRITASTDFILRGIANNTAGSFFSFAKCWIKVSHTS